MTVIIDGTKVKTDATTTAFRSNYTSVTIRYGDQIMYVNNFGSTHFGWFIGTSPTGSSEYMLTTSNRIIICKKSISVFNWSSAVNDIVYSADSYKDAIATLDNNRP